MNHPLCLVRRLVLSSAAAALVGCTLGLVCALPVQADVHLAYFTAEGREDDVLIAWGTGNEETTYGFNLYRSAVEGARPSLPLNEEMIRAKSFGEFSGADYSYVDGEVEIGVTYYYWLEVLDLGPGLLTDSVSATPGPPPTSTPTSTPTGLPTATPTWTPTTEPTSTPTLAPTATASPTPTTLPAATTTTLPTATSLPTNTSAASPTSSIEQVASPTATAESSIPPAATSSALPGQLTPTPTATSVTGGSDIPPGEDSQIGTSGWSSLRLRWPTIYPSTILLSLSLMSLMGVLLLSIALALVRRFGL